MGMTVKFEKKEKRKSSLENCFLNSPRKEILSVNKWGTECKVAVNFEESREKYNRQTANPSMTGVVECIGCMFLLCTVLC